MLTQMRPDQSAEALATVGRSIGVTGGGGAQYPLEDRAFGAPDSDRAAPGSGRSAG